MMTMAEGTMTMVVVVTMMVTMIMWVFQSLDLGDHN